ncbi:hypothetical protein ACFLJZ_000190 [Vibrio alginolyticus]
MSYKIGDIKDIFIVYVDGLKDLPDAINIASPTLNIVHVVRNSMKYM